MNPYSIRRRKGLFELIDIRTGKTVAVHKEKEVVDGIRNELNEPVDIVDTMNQNDAAWETVEGPDDPELEMGRKF
jgi:hypothetical protein